MKFGFCTSVECLPAIAGAGYDFIELGLAGTLRPEDPEAEVMPAMQERFAGQPILAEAFNVFLPGELKVVGPEIDTARQERYLAAAFARVAALGGQVVVFGSGRSRNVPESFPRAQAERQIVDFLKRAGPLAAAQDVTVVIEPLNTGECNLLNSVAEGVRVARAVGHRHVRVLSDLYHVDREGQSHEETRAAGEWLHHVHVAGAEGRRVPNAQDVDYLAPFFGVLKEMGYVGRISVEGGASDIARQAPEALESLQKAWRIA